jgi:hypothetical protein
MSALDTQWNPERAEVIARVLGQIVASELPPLTSDFYRQHIHVADDAKIWDLILEDIWFSAHLLDRIAFAELGPDARPVFVNTLIESMAEDLWMLCPTDAGSEEFRMWFGSFFNIRNNEYGACRRLFPEEGEVAVGGTLFWEFGRKMSLILSDSNPARTILISTHGTGLFRIMLAMVEKSFPTKER